MSKTIHAFFIIIFMSSFSTGCGNKAVTKENSQTVLVQMHNDSTRLALEQQFVQYALEEEKVVSRPMNIYLFQFDPAKVSASKLIELLKESQLVKEAQTNKDVSTRRN